MTTRRTINIVAGIAFLAFAAWTLRGDELTDEEEAKAAPSQGAAILAVGVAFFLAELGDKTMLATITLATPEGWLGTWIGSTIGMVAADALAIVVGALLGRRLPEKAIRYGATAAFVVFGVLLIVQGVTRLTGEGAGAAVVGSSGMQTRTLGNQQVGAIGLGLMTFDQTGTQPRQQLLDTVTAALDAGVTLFDSADAYGPGDEKGAGAQGENERLIASILDELGVRDRVFLATKGGHVRTDGGGWDADSSAAHLHAAVDASLRAPRRRAALAVAAPPSRRRACPTTRSSAR